MKFITKIEKQGKDYTFKIPKDIGKIINVEKNDALEITIKNSKFKVIIL